MHTDLDFMRRESRKPFVGAAYSSLRPVHSAPEPSEASPPLALLRKLVPQCASLRRVAQDFGREACTGDAGFSHVPASVKRQGRPPQPRQPAPPRPPSSYPQSARWMLGCNNTASCYLQSDKCLLFLLFYKI